MIIYSPTFTGSVQLTGSQIVTGDFTVRGNLTAQQFILSSSVTFYTESFSSGSTRFGDSMDDTMVVTGSLRLTGSMGIGVANPSSLVEISKGSNAGSGASFPRLAIKNTLATQGDGSSTFNFADILVSSGNEAVNMFLATTYAAGTWAPAGIINVSTNHDLQIKTNNTERMRISSSGKIIVAGTTAGTALDDSITINTANSTGYSGIICTTAGTQRGYYGATSTGLETGVAGSGYYSLWTSGVERMRITSGGNVKIGNTSGDGRFYVKTSVANSFSPTVYAGANANIRLETGGTPAENITTGISFGVGGAAEAYIGAVQNSSTYADIVFQNYNGAYAERMRILSSGNVRFSSQVYGNTVASPRTLYIQSDGELGGVSSIRESKKNIENVSNINWIYQLNPVSFNYRKKDEEGNYTEEIYDEINYGLIAEDTAPVADFLINYNDKEDSTKEMVGIEYMRLITPMLKAIQELKAEIEELKNK
jgi:hypothetical protein